MRVAVVAAVACLSAVGLCAAQDVQASIRKSTNIPAQELMPALKTLAYERGFQLVFLSKVVGTKHTQGAVGDLTTSEALTSLLEGTNLVYSYLDEKTVTITPVNPNSKLDGRSPSAKNLQRCSGLASDKTGYAASLNQTGSGSTAMSQTGSEAASACIENYSQQNQLLVAALAGGDAEPVQDSDGESKSNKESTASITKLEEVVVTAQKREERMQEVPVPVTAISTDALVRNGQLRFQDYFSAVPGLNINSGCSCGTTLSIRGISTGSGNPTVGITVDDVPYGSSSGPAFGGLIPDIDPSELSRIEVLRGPQGTLYGAASIGGLLKYVTADPSTQDASGRIEGDASSVRNGNEVGYGLRGAVNVPISEAFAVRASGFTRRDPGYVNNVTYGISGVNQVDVDGGRLSILWRPSDAVSLKLGALLQNTNGGGWSNNVTPQPGLGDLQQSILRGGEGYDQRIRLYTATVTAKLGKANLTSVTGYGLYRTTGSIDLSSIYGGAGSSISETCCEAAGAIASFSGDTRKLTQEFRLSSTIGSRVDWLLGAFYTHENSPMDAPVYAADAKTGALAGLIYDQRTPSSFVEYSGFADLTVHFADRFDLQFGARESTNRQVYDETDSGPVIPLYFNGQASPLVIPRVRTKDSAFTYLLTPRFKISPDSMIYARIASGYRPGGPNADATLFHFPDHVGPDKTINYELGAKGDMLDHRLSVDASLYYIKWKDIQVQVVDPVSFFGYQENASSAKSQGVELSGQAKPLDGLTVAAWVAWNDAVLTSDLPISQGSAIGFAGDRLPFSSRWSGSVSLEQEVPLTSAATGVVGVAVSYIANRQGGFATSIDLQRFDFPAYAKTDLHAGVRYESWLFNAFANNVTDRRGVLNGQLLVTQPFISYIQPRTVGVSVVKTFSVRN